MKKSLKIALIVACSLVLSGMLCVFIAFCSSGFNIKGIFQQNYETQTVIIENCENLKNIDLDEQFFDVALYPAKDGICRIEFPVVDNVSLNYQLEQDGTALTNTIADNRKWYEKFNWGLNSSDCKTKIYLPENEYETFKIKSTSGDVDFKYALTVGNCEITTTSGDIGFSNSGSSNISLATTSGDIYFTYVSKCEISLTTSSGDIYVGDVRDASLLAYTQSGDITSKSNSFKRFNVSTQSGDIEVSKTNASEWIGIKSLSGDILVNEMKGEKIYFTTTSGDVEFDMLENTSLLTIETQSGDVDGNLLNSTRFEVETNSGSSNIDGDTENSGIFCSVKTTSGDINIKAPK